MKNQPSVILLSADALRADHLGYHGYSRDTSPFLDRLSEDVVTFTQAISASPHTREAVPALLSGRYPDVFAANGYRYVSPTMADRLSQVGYRTAGFHSNPYVSRAYGFDSGFDSFDDDLVFGRNKIVALAQRALNKFVLNRGDYHARANEINDRSLEWIDSLDDDEPFFLWNHYMDPHGPYNPPEGYTYADRELSNDDAQELYQKCIDRPDEITEEERQLLIDCYDGEIRYLDEQLSAFFEALSERELLDESLFIVTADHGDAFGEHGYFTHPRQLHEYLLHVPLLVSPPGGCTAETISKPVSTLDIVPTISAFSSFEADELPGTPLVDESGTLVQSLGGTVFASATGEDENAGTRRFAVRNHRRKVVLERDIETGEILSETAFDLVGDPDETGSRDVEATDVTDLRDQLISFSSTHTSAKTSEETTEPSAEIEDRLEALGYK
jgi:arylsulfatase